MRWTWKTQQLKVAMSGSDPVWGVIYPKGNWFSTGVCHSGFFYCFFTFNRQGAIADGLHGLNPRNTAHRYTPDVATSVNVATGKSQVHGGNKACG
jgi:hypothetical protein